SHSVAGGRRASDRRRQTPSPASQEQSEVKRQLDEAAKVAIVPATRSAILPGAERPSPISHASSAPGDLAFRLRYRCAIAALLRRGVSGAATRRGAPYSCLVVRAACAWRR